MYFQQVCILHQAGGQGCSSEGPEQAGEVGWQGPQEVQQKHMPSPAPGQTEIPTQGDRLRASSMEKPPGAKLTRISSTLLQQRRLTMPWAVLGKEEPAGEGRDPTPPFSTCLSNLEQERQRGELTAICSYLKKRRRSQALPRDLQQQHKKWWVQAGTWQVPVRYQETNLTLWVVQSRDRAQRVSILEILKTWLGKALSNLIKLQIWP